MTALDAAELARWRVGARQRLLERNTAGRMLSVAAAETEAEAQLAGTPDVHAVGAATIWLTHLEDGAVLEDAVGPAAEVLVAAEQLAAGSPRLTLTVPSTEPDLAAAAIDRGYRPVSDRMRLALADVRPGPRPLALFPATGGEREAFAADHVAGYVASGLRAGAVDEAAATRRARAETRRAIDNPAMALYSARADGEAVGVLWLELSARRAWVLQVSVAEAQRGHGYGRALMVAAEDAARAAGAPVLGLAVFAWNTVARRLYDSLGYVVTEQTLARDLR